MHIVIIGEDGQLGTDFMDSSIDLGYKVTGLTHSDLEIADRKQVFKVLSDIDFDVIINTSAYHGYKAYEDNSPIKYYSVNTFGPYYLAQYVEENDKCLVHFSTDYVFSGNICSGDYSYTENDNPEPSNLYAASKLAGEKIISTIANNYFIFRLASLYGSRGCKAKNNSNFVELTLKKLYNNEKMEIVDDIIMSPTSTKSVIIKTIELLKSEKHGLYHLSGSGKCSWYDFALKIAELSGLDMDLIVRSSYKKVEQKINRGKNTSLLNNKLINNGFDDLPNWQDCLKDYLTKNTDNKK